MAKYLRLRIYGSPESMGLIGTRRPTGGKIDIPDGYLFPDGTWLCRCMGIGVRSRERIEEDEIDVSFGIVDAEKHEIIMGSGERIRTHIGNGGVYGPTFVFRKTKGD